MENTGLVNSFSQFLSEKTAYQKENLQGSLLSFTEEISSFDFNNKIDSILKSSENSFYFSSIHNNLSLIALDQAYNITENGQARFISTDKKLKDISSRLISNRNDNKLPLFVGGMKFTVEHSDADWKEFSDSTWFVPEIIICRFKERTFLIYNYFAEQGFSKTRLTEKFSKKVESFFKITEDKKKSLPRVVNSSGLSPKDKKKWKKVINQALEKINDNEIKKIVLSRKIELTLSEEINLTESFNKLRDDYPNCTLFAYHKGNSTFFGATPELLARLSNHNLEVDAIAGSISRGETKEADQKLETELLNNKKDLDEHQYVLEHLTAALNNIGNNINFTKAPVIKKLKNIQHLSTKISVELKENTSVMNILNELHPTPAVCGLPKESALNLIKKIENQKRGLYSGIIGWFNFNNEGEFAVSIRSAVTKGNKLIAFAGNGIVAGSEPDKEFEETEMKLKPILSLLNEKKD